jgi:23S rRNA (guanosine2251-2'-O)-methyltransferase
VSDLLYGIHPLCEALSAGRRRVSQVYVSKGRRIKGIETLLALARAAGVPVHHKGSDYFKARLGGSVHQGLAAQVGELPLATEGAMVQKAETKSELPLILALDGMVDPQNLGSIVRSALAMGVHGIVLPKARSAPLSPAVSKASAGAMEHMLFARVSNLVAALQRLKKLGLWIIGAHSDSGQPVYQADLKVGLALVIGGEAKGIRPLVRKTCDFLVSIPQKEKVDSLNAAVAGAVIMYEIGRQRGSKRVKV